MTKFLKPALVEAIIAAQGNKATTVVFAKVSGEIVERNGLPKVYKRRVQADASPESKERSARQTQTLKNNGMLFFDAPQKDKRGFSFRKTHVQEIRAGGAIIASA